MERNRYDVAIAGAGLTGQLMALALAEQGLSIALVDPAPGSGNSGDPRTTALAYACIRLLKRLDLWEPLENKAGEISDILVTNGRPRDRFRQGGLTGGQLHFPSSILPEGRTGPEGSPLGYVLKNADMLSVFRERIEQSSHIDLIETASDTPRHGKGQTILPLTDGREIISSLLIACDGRPSPIRDALGFRSQKWRYGQKALAFNLKHENPHGGVAQEIFYPDGPFAILPLAGNEVSIVWTLKDPGTDAFKTLSDEDLLDEVRARAGDYLGDIELASRPVAFPMSLVYVNHPVKDRVVLAGDAYHGIHPIAGQGFNLGVKDIAAMADVIADATQHGLDIGAPNVLENYVQWRRFDASAIAFGTDGFVRLFSNDHAPIRWARGIGLGLVQKFDPARIFFMRQAGADTGDLPQLMRPL